VFTFLTAGSARQHGRRTFVAAGVLGLGVLLAAGCSSSGGSKPATSTSTSTTTTKPKATDAVFNVVITGDRPATITGAKGSCSIDGDSAPQYSLSSTDYPALGPSGELSVTGKTVVPGSDPVPASLKLVVADAGFLAPSTGAGITIKPNQKVVMLDTDLSGGVSGENDANINDPDNSLHGHITGSITCS
jgi:hypothetical protein